MNCPKCSKVMLDVRAEKTNPKAPDFQCPDASCLNDKGYRTGAWLPKGQRASPVQPPAVANMPGGSAWPISAPPSAPSAPQAQNGASGRDAALVRLYWDCFDEILAGLKTRAVKDGFHDEQIAACVATLYIARSKVL